MSPVTIVNVGNGGSATVDPALAEVLLAGGAWKKPRKAPKPATEPAPVPANEDATPDK